MRAVIGTRNRKAPAKRKQAYIQFIARILYDPCQPPPTVQILQNDTQAGSPSETEEYGCVLDRAASARPKNIAGPADYEEAVAPLLGLSRRGEPPAEEHVASQSTLVYFAEYSGRVAAIDGSRVIIEFEVEGEDEEREFSREDLNIDDDLLKVGCRVVARTSLEFPGPTEPPTAEQKRAIRARRVELEKEWAEIDPRQTPIVRGIGS